MSESQAAELRCGLQKVHSNPDVIIIFSVSLFLRFYIDNFQLNIGKCFFFILRRFVLRLISVHDQIVER